jgi:hypothetical protein
LPEVRNAARVPLRDKEGAATGFCNRLSSFRDLQPVPHVLILHMARKTAGDPIGVQFQ